MSIMAFFGHIDGVQRRNQQPKPNVTDTLPSELLAEIFMLAVRDERFEDEGLEEEPSCLMPLNMVASSVCKRWRDIALHTPLLWQYINIESAKEYDWAQLCLTRSASCPLDLEFYWDIDEVGKEFGAEEMDWLMHHIFLPHVAQWREVTFNVDSSDCLPSLALHLRAIESLPLLETLELSQRGESLPFDDTYPFKLIPGSTPLLTALELWDIEVSYEDFLFTNLTRLELNHVSQPTPTQLSSILRLSADTLQILNLRGIDLFPAFPHSPKVVTFPSLRAVTLATLSSEEGAAFIVSMIHAPNVEELTVDDWDAEQFDRVISSLPKSFPSTRKLVLGRILIAETSLEVAAYNTLFQAMPKIEHLDLDCAWLTTDLGDVINRNLPLPSSLPPTPIPDGGPHLPSLEILQVSGADFNSVTRFAKRRLELGKPLKKVLLDNEYAFMSGEVVTLQQFVKEVTYFEKSDEEETDSDEDDDDDENEYEGYEDSEEGYDWSESHSDGSENEENQTDTDDSDGEESESSQPHIPSNRSAIRGGLDGEEDGSEWVDTSASEDALDEEHLAVHGDLD